MSIGYASKTLAAPGARMQSVVQRRDARPPGAGDRRQPARAGRRPRLPGENGIHLFRISSDVSLRVEPRERALRLDARL